MNAKSVAERAAEMGADQGDLVRALKALCKHHTRSQGYYRSKIPHFSLAEACSMLGVDPEDAEKAIQASYPAPWTESMILDALFRFMKKNDRFPKQQDFGLANDMPSYWSYSNNANSAWVWPRQNWVSPRDYWERKIAADKRCDPTMAIQLRNVLARKEAIERIGFQTFIKKGLALLIDEDPEFGQLYQLPGETPSEPMILLKVVNSTPDPDGTFSDYYLRVPPNMTNAREAVRWTFHGDEALGTQPYAPLIQT